MSTPTCPEHPPWEPVDGWYWHSGHVHLVSWLTAQQAADRWCVITTKKPVGERALRSRLFAPLARPYPPWLAQIARLGAEIARLWVEIARLGAEIARLWVEIARLGAEIVRFGAERDRLLCDHAEALAVLHASECPDCPWNGHTILP